MTQFTKCAAFIVGMPRAGTTYISKILNNHHTTVSTGESLYWGRNFIDPENSGYYNEKQLFEILERLKFWNWEPKISDIKKSEFHKMMDEEFLQIKTPCTPDQPFDALANSFCKLYNKSVFIEKTPHHINWLSRIQTYYPNAKFVIAQRDPYSFMLSYKYQGLQKSKEVRDIFEKIYHPISCALVWRKNYRSIQKACEDFPSNTFIFKQEKLNSLEQLRLLEDFLELEKHSLNLIEKDNSSFEKSERKFELNTIDVFWMNVVARKEIDISQYNKRSVFPNPFALIWSIMIIPYKLFISTYILSKNSNRSIFSYLSSYLNK